MRKINNPFNRRENAHCFGCSTTNPFGLHMEFHEDGDEIICKWQPRDFFQGYNFVLHGGIQATLADEIASWVVFVKLKTAGVTTNLNINYKKPLYTNKGEIVIKAKLLKVNKRIAEIEVKLYNHENVLCAEAIVSYFLLSEEKAKSVLGYPNSDEFD